MSTIFNKAPRNIVIFDCSHLGVINFTFLLYFLSTISRQYSLVNNFLEARLSYSKLILRALKQIFFLVRWQPFLSEMHLGIKCMNKETISLAFERVRFRSNVIQGKQKDYVY